MSDHKFAENKYVTYLFQKELKAAISIMTTLGLGWLILPLQFIFPSQSSGKVFIQFLFIILRGGYQANFFENISFGLGPP